MLTGSYTDFPFVVGFVLAFAIIRAASSSVGRLVKICTATEVVPIRTTTGVVSIHPATEGLPVRMSPFQPVSAPLEIFFAHSRLPSQAHDRRENRQGFFPGRSYLLR